MASSMKMSASRSDCLTLCMGGSIRVMTMADESAAIAEKDLPRPRPAPAGAINVVDYPHRNDQQPGAVWLAWPAEHPHPLTDEFIGVVRGRTANSSRTQSGIPPRTLMPCSR